MIPDLSDPNWKLQIAYHFIAIMRSRENLKAVTNKPESFVVMRSPIILRICNVLCVDDHSAACHLIYFIYIVKF